jgi:hypothetical protein
MSLRTEKRRAGSAKHRARLATHIASEARRPVVRALAVAGERETVAILDDLARRTQVAFASVRTAKPNPLGIRGGWDAVREEAHFHRGLVESDEMRVRPEPYDHLEWSYVGTHDDRVMAVLCPWYARTHAIGYAIANVSEDRLSARGVAFKQLVDSVDGAHIGRIVHVNPSTFARRALPALDLADGAQVSIAIDDTAHNYRDTVDHGVSDPRTSQVIKVLAFRGEKSQAERDRRWEVRAAWGRPLPQD